METAVAKTEINQKELDTFLGTVVNDMSAALSGVMVNLGNKLGLYEAMANEEAVTAKQLAQKTGLRERYVQEWLNNQAAGGYVTYNSVDKTFCLTPEHAMVLADKNSPVFLTPGFDLIASVWLDEEKIAKSFKSDKGMGWHEHDHHLFSGTEAFFRPGYKSNLATNWIPALEGMEEKLKQGATVADIGCGHGASTIIMAQAYPNSRFFGFDYHNQSVETARKRADEAGVADRVSFETATAQNFPGKGYDLICFMDCFHDFGDPLTAAKHAKEALANDGAVLMVEPFANDNLEENLNPIGRMYYAASTAICVPNSLSQEVGLGLGAQAGESRLGKVMHEAGFSTFRRATQTPFNLVFEGKA